MIEKSKNKYVFFDVDGTLSEYRYKDILYGGECPELGCQSLEDLLFNNLFYTARPLKTMLKPEVIIEYCKHYNFDIKDAVFVDDRLDVLRKAETLGITAYHPSSFTE